VLEASILLRPNSQAKHVVISSDFVENPLYSSWRNASIAVSTYFKVDLPLVWLEMAYFRLDWARSATPTHDKRPVDHPLQRLSRFACEIMDSITYADCESTFCAQLSPGIHAREDLANPTCCGWLRCDGNIRLRSQYHCPWTSRCPWKLVSTTSSSYERH
jgi:hypothetical protein